MTSSVLVDLLIYATRAWLGKKPAPSLEIPYYIERCFYNNELTDEGKREVTTVLLKDFEELLSDNTELNTDNDQAGWCRLYKLLQKEKARLDKFSNSGRVPESIRELGGVDKVDDNLASTDWRTLC